MDENRAKIRAFLSRFFRVDNLQDDDDIFALGLINSLFAMQMVLWVEKEFGIKVEDEDLDIENFNTINALAGFVERKSQARLKTY
jgi:acyl carrier protein